MSATPSTSHCRLAECSGGGLFADTCGRVKRQRTVLLSGLALCSGGPPVGRQNPTRTVMLGIKALSATGYDIRARFASPFNSAVSS
jgi:hypothetical protein